jgi:hypothetical protein
MNHSEHINEIAAAMAKAQAEMQNAVFDSTNPHFKNRFASLAAVRDAVIAPLSRNGIAVFQDILNVEGGISCTTILVHASGQKMEFGPLIMPFTKADAQGFGSAATYCKRYHLMAVGCISGDSDDDANAATGKPQNGAYAEPHRPQGDMAKNVPTDEARSTALAMLGIIDKPAADGDHDEKAKAFEAYEYHQKYLVGHDELYIAAAEQLTAPKRNSWKGLIALARKAEKEDRATDPTRPRF